MRRYYLPVGNLDKPVTWCSPPAGTVVGVETRPLDTETPQGRELAIEAALIDDRRVVVLDGVHNFRDLGGYPAAGGTTRWELVYRADGLGRLTAEDVEVLRARGLGTVIDLRTDRE